MKEVDKNIIADIIYDYIVVGMLQSEIGNKYKLEQRSCISPLIKKYNFNKKAINNYKSGQSRGKYKIYRFRDRIHQLKVEKYIIQEFIRKFDGKMTFEDFLEQHYYNKAKDIICNDRLYKNSGCNLRDNNENKICGNNKSFNSVNNMSKKTSNNDGMLGCASIVGIGIVVLFFIKIIKNNTTGIVSFMKFGFAIGFILFLGSGFISNKKNNNSGVSSAKKCGLIGIGLMFAMFALSAFSCGEAPAGVILGLIAFAAIKSAL
ncbi:hypothetical protein [Clostridium sp. ZBS15]|uniref:hypothetical protein n=1 Tax=Clostridium sp. ZBS15 TaxID=2949969 RepID=UPI00207B01C0|nr:hypothetical protein [Clostridium sp. ZBS15]